MSENIIIVNYASFFSRLVAYFIDIFSIYIITYLIATLMGFEDTEFYRYNEEHMSSYRFFTHHRGWNYSSFIIWQIYSVIMDASNYRGTHGKRFMRLIVSNDTGNRISLKQSLLRNLFKIVSIFPFALGFIWIIFNKQNKGWHDIIANTLVLRESKGLVFKDDQNK